MYSTNVMVKRAIQHRFPADGTHQLVRGSSPGTTLGVYAKGVEDIA